MHAHARVCVCVRHVQHKAERKKWQWNMQPNVCVLTTEHAMGSTAWDANCLHSARVVCNGQQLVVTGRLQGDLVQIFSGVGKAQQRLPAVATGGRSRDNRRRSQVQHPHSP